VPDSDVPDPAVPDSGVPAALVSVPPAQDPLALESQVCFALSAAARAMVAVYRPILEPLRLTHPQYLVMLALWQHGDLSMTTIAALVHLDPGTVTPLVKRLESTGYVTRRRDADDARVMVVSLTAEGAALRSVAEGIPPQVVARTGLTLDELADVRRSVARVVEAGRDAGVL
jgi:MarR family transcriptional regulator, organic hydroperoxide resistance regulator